ncbi:sulfatase-like hydrolase/transferase [Natronospora cellulosivora (SeqCode)]
MDKPNVIFIFSDQQRWDSMGCYGQKLDVTPNLDKMAEEGVRFENAFTCQPVCGPARASIQTGKYATEIGCYRNDIALPQDEKTIAHWFTDAGYEVGYIGKWHLASTGGKSSDDIGEHFSYKTEAVPLEYRGGWKDYWLAADILEGTSHPFEGHMFDKDMNKVEFEGYRADRQTDFVLDYIRSRDGEKPFFLFTSYLEPHHQNDQGKYVGPEGSKERFKDYEIPEDLKGTEGDWRENYPDYLGCCASLDENVGRIRDELEKLGIAENTVIIYTSDHGSHFKTRNVNVSNGFDDYKRSCHESAIRIPMIAYGPGFNGGKVIDELVSLIDIPSTLVNCAGIENPSYMQGRPLQELAKGDVDDWAEEVFLQISESQVGRAIRTKRWKYSVKAPGKHGARDSKSDVYVEQYLYDLEKDPYEKNNLVANSDYADIRTELAERLKRRMKDANEDVPEILAADDNN